MQIKRLPYDPDAGDEVVQPAKLAVLFKWDEELNRWALNMPDLKIISDL